MPRLGGTGYKPDSDIQRWMDRVTGRMAVPVFSIPGEGGIVETQNYLKFNPPVKSQDGTNFCVHFGVCAAIEYVDTVINGNPYTPMSELFCAWNGAMPGHEGHNDGTQIYRCAEQASIWGVCSNDEYPWELNLPGDFMQRMKFKPDAEAYEEASRMQVLDRVRIEDGDVATMLSYHKSGFGLVFGLPLRQGFDRTGSDGIVTNSGGITGWHAMFSIDGLSVEGRQRFRIRNSWSPGFGDHGNCYISLDSMKEARDIHVIRGMEKVIV